jgi:EpsI family protein
MTWRYLIAILLLTGTIVASKLGGDRKPEKLIEPISAIPDRIDGWQQVSESRFSQQVETKLAATQYLSRVYRKGNVEAGLLVSYYAEQRAGESMHSPRNCLPGAGWEAWEYDTVYVPVGNQRFKVNRYGVEKEGQREQVLYWYQNRDRIIASEYAGKVLLVWDTITGGSTGGALVRLTMADTPQAVSQEIRLASQVIPAVQRCFGTAPPSR